MHRRNSISSKALRYFCLILVGLSYCKMALALEKDAFFYLLDGEFLGGYSKVVKKSGIASTNNHWSVSPNLMLVKDALYWINLYNGSLDRSSQVVAQEEGGRQSESTQTHSLSTAIKIQVNPVWALRPLFFTDWVFVNETEDESFGNGLYDYRDIGGGLESVWVEALSKTIQREIRAGFRYFDRTYPNYQSLLSQFDTRPQVTEEKEKDFVGYKSSAGVDVQNQTGWSYGLEAVLLYKDFDDKRTIDSNGIRSADETRADYLANLNAYLGHPLFGGWSARLDGQYAQNTSNLDFYDTHNTTSLTDDTFIGEYFDYFSLTANPSLAYEKELSPERFFRFILSYSFTAQIYPERNVQDVLGVYQSAKERDYTHTFSARISYPLTKYVSWVTTASYTISDSNQDYEAYYLYSYDLWSVLSGVSFKY